MQTTNRNFCNLIFILQFHFLLPSINSSQRLLGVHPLDEKYYASEVIKCKDGTKTFNKEHLNDDFCDCVDGTDEPGTSACPRGKFYCRNAGSIPRFVFSSRVNDQICDCCDGSDEYGSGISCPNICIMGGNLEYKAGNIGYNAGNHKSYLGEKESKIAVEDLLQKATGLKIAVIIQIALIGCTIAFRVCRHIRLKRRRLR